MNLGRVGRWRWLLVAGLLMVLTGAGVALVRGYQSFRLDRRFARDREIRAMLELGVTSYGIDRCGFYMPPDTWYRRRKGAEIPQTFETDVEFITKLPVGSRSEPVEFWQPLSTPIAYIARAPDDPFRPGHPYLYKILEIASFDYPSAGILVSAGPDGRIDLDVDSFYGDFLEWRREACDMQGRLDAGIALPVLVRRVLPFVYDPTNGVHSGGDLISFHSEWVKFDEPWPDAVARIAERERRQQALPHRVVPGLGAAPRISVPSSFADALLHFMEATSLRSNDPHNALEHSSNQFDPVLWPIFEDPAILNETQQRACDTMRDRTPEWWAFIDSPGLLGEGNEAIAIENDLLTVYTPLVGKSLLIASADDASRGNLDEARRRLAELDALTRLLQERDMNQLRMKDTLRRLYDRMLAVLDGMDAARQ